MATRTARPAFGLLLILACVPDAYAERLATTTYTTAHGLPHPEIRSIISDSRGFVWFATRLGLGRFDGQRFFTYGIAEGLPISSVNHLLETSRGTYWVATNGAGVCRLNVVTSAKTTGGVNSRFSTCVAGGTPEARRVNVLYEDRGGQIWAGTDGGLLRLSEANGKPELEPIALGVASRPDRALQIWALAEGSNGSLWIGTSWGLARRRSDGRTTHYGIQPQRGFDNVRTVEVDGENRLWIGHDTGLIVFRPDDAESSPRDSHLQLSLRPASTHGTIDSRPGPGAAIRFTSADGLSGQNVMDLHLSPEGDVWIGTSQGLTRFDGARFTPDVAAQRHVVRAVARDRAGHIWISGEDGAVKLAATGFVRYTEADGIPQSQILSVFENRAGELRVVVPRQLVHRFDGNRFTAVQPNLSADRREADGLGPAFEDRAGEWWVPGAAGLYRFAAVDTLEQLSRASPKAIYTSRDGLPGEDVFRVLEDSRGDIWIARRAPTGSALTRWQRSTATFHRYSESDGLPAFRRARSIAEDRSGSVWVGFWGGGLVRYRNGRITLFTESDGAPGNIGSIHVDRGGRLWITGGDGLTRVDALESERPAFVRHTTAQGLTSNLVFSITDDLQGRIYLGMSSGVDRLDPVTGAVRHFALPDGLAGREVDVAFCDRRGTLWFGTPRGLMSFVPPPDRPGSPPAVFIGGLRISGETRAISELGETRVPALALGPSQNQVQIDYFSISTASPVVRYQYRLEDADREWSEPTDQRSVNFASLSPGRYRFLVRAISADGLVSPVPASVDFRIAPPVWQRWWFLSGAALLLAMLTFAVHRSRVARLLELERVHTRIATDLHDDIGSSLTQIAILSEVAERRMTHRDPAVIQPISRVSSISRELVDSMSDIVWSIDPKHDRLLDLSARMRRFAADMLATRRIALRFRSPEELQDVPIDTDRRRQAFLVFKEAVHNAVRHSRCTEIQIDFGLDAQHVVLRISDNGRGFDAEGATEGHGLASMRARTSAIGGRLDITSRPGHGTTVRFDIPLAGRSAGLRKAR
jgi:signal transduction histidine kinase/ligand-binding sensor domain-containing protein